MQLCVFCGSKAGNEQHHQVPALREFVRRLGQQMAATDTALVYGGGRVGLMGILADAVLEKRGRVIGIIPDFMMSAEVAHHGLTDLQIVDSMHERKIAMFNQSDAFVALPGGFGTLDELFEVLTLSQLGLLNGRGQVAKPILIFNDKDFFTPLLKQTEVMENWGFLQGRHRDLIEVVSEETRLYSRLQQIALSQAET